jgi:hypothetical protein
MAQLKRLTRTQKILLSRLRAGFEYAQRANPVDLAALEKHGLIVLDQGKWVAVEEPQPELAGTSELKKLQEKFNG